MAEMGVRTYKYLTLGFFTHNGSLYFAMPYVNHLSVHRVKNGKICRDYGDTVISPDDPITMVPITEAKKQNVDVSKEDNLFDSGNSRIWCD